MDQASGDSVQEKIRWRSWDGSGLEDLVLTYEADCMAMRSTVIAGQLDSGFVVQYSIDASPDWHVIKVEAAVVGVEKAIILYRIEGNHWFDESKTEILLLRGCVDIDLSVTPLTNTFPIRRLQLGVGESAEVEAAYIEFPSLFVSRNLQRYTRLSPLTYRYQAVGTDFVREIVVDQDDLVFTYAGLFRRSQRFRAVQHEPALDPDNEVQTSSPPDLTGACP